MANFDARNYHSPQLSPKASQLHRSILESFNSEDQAKFTEILTRYQQNKNIQRFAESLHEICKTTQQREEIYPLIRSFLPQKHKERFDYECGRPKSAHTRPHYATYSKRHSPNYGYFTTRSLPADTRYRQTGSSSGNERRAPTLDSYTTPKPRRERKESNARVVVLEREIEGESFGFSIRGGSEYNIGLFVSSVDEGYIAHDAGICLGDQILEVNRLDFRNISHQEAVQVIQGATILHMLVKSVGKIPGSFKSSSSYRWIDPRGNEVSPPSQYANMMNGDKSEMRLLGDDDERKVNLFIADGAEIGLKIRGGVEHGLGIFIASVEPNSGADRAGIQVGDQILDVNGTSFLHITHEEAVRVLKSSQQLVIMLKDIGILPHGKRVYDETRWIRDAETKNSSRPSSSSSTDRKSKTMKKTPSFHDPMGSSQLTHHSVLDHSDEILEMKARQLLPSDDLHAFEFYLDEYRANRLSLTSFLTVLSDLLNSSEKGSLFREIRIAILPRDLAKFDEWTEKKFELSQQACNTDRRQTKHDRLSLYSYKSSDSSTTTNSWLGLFESRDGKSTKSNVKTRHKRDSLPHPPEEFFDDSSESSSRVRNSSCERVSGDINGQFGTKLNDREVGVVKDSPTKQTSKASFDGHLQHHQAMSSRHSPNYLTNRKTDMNEAAREEEGQLTTNMDRMGSNSSYYDDDLYTCVDQKESKTISKNAAGKSALPNGATLDGLYSSVDDTGYDRKHMDSIFSHNYTSNGSTSIGNPQAISNVQNGLANVSKANSLMQNEQDNVAIYSTVDKSNITPKQTNDFLEENEFEIPPPIPDKLFFDSEDFEDNIPNMDTECNGRDSNYNSEIKFNNDFLLPETSRVDSKGKFSRNTSLDTNTVPRNVTVEMNMVSKNTAVETGKFSRDAAVETEKVPRNIVAGGTSKVSRNTAVETSKVSKNTAVGTSKDPGNTAVETNIASFSELYQFNEKSYFAKSDRRDPSHWRVQKMGQRYKFKISKTEYLVYYNQPFVVELTKHSSNLGLSVAGGTDTDSKEIRIKSIKSEGTVAGSCPLLQTGQIILGVDDKSLQNVTSGIAAMAIRQAFHSDKTVLKLILQNDTGLG